MWESFAIIEKFKEQPLTSYPKFALPVFVSHLSTNEIISFQFLAVLTVALMLQCCVCRLSVTLCIVAKRCVLEQKLLLTAYRKSYMRKRLVPK